MVEVTASDAANQLLQINGALMRQIESVAQLYVGVVLAHNLELTADEWASTQRILGEGLMNAVLPRGRRERLRVEPSVAVASPEE